MQLRQCDSLFPQNEGGILPEAGRIGKLREGLIQSLGHENVVAGDLNRYVRSERGSAGFVVAEMAVKGGKGRRCADDAEVDHKTAGLAEEILGGIHEQAAQAATLALRLDAEEAKVAAITAKFNVRAASQTGGVFSNKEFALGHVGANTCGVDAVTLDEGLLDAEGSGDQMAEGVNVVGVRGAETQCVGWREKFGRFAHTRNNILTRIPYKGFGNRARMR